MKKLILLLFIPFLSFGQSTNAITAGEFPFYEDCIKKLQNSGINLFYLACWWDILDYCKEKKTIIDVKTIDQIEEFLNSPKEWSQKHDNKN